MKGIKRCLVWLCMGVFLSAIPALAQEDISDLSPWNGRHITMGLGSSNFSADVMRPVFEAIAESTPELSPAQVETAYAELANTDFDSFSVAGRLVTFATANGPIVCRYSYAGTEALTDTDSDAEGNWHLFEAGAACTDYRYLALGLPQASELSSGFQFRYGDDLEALTQGGNYRAWYPAAYPDSTPVADILADYTENAAALGAALTQQGVEVADEADVDEGDMTEAEHDLEHEESERDFTEVTSLDHRVVVTYDGGVATLDTASGDVIDMHDMPGFLRLNAAGDGRHLLVTTGAGWEVFDVGLDAVEHGDHYHYYEAEPNWSGSVFGAETPAHVVTQNGLTALFDDGTGQITLFDPTELGSDAQVETDTSYAVPEAHHGVAVPLAGDELIITVGNADERSGAALLDTNREMIAEANNCPGVHGETVAADDVVVVGCEDGVIILRDGQWHKVNGDMAGTGYARSGNLRGTHTSPIVLGEYRPVPDEPMTSVVLIDTRNDSLSTLELDAPYTFRNLARGPESEALVLTESGALHIIDPESGEITNSIEGIVEAWVEPEEWQEPRPTLTVAEKIAYVTEPATSQVHAVDIASGDVLASYELGVVPNEIEIVTGFGNEVHSDEDAATATEPSEELEAAAPAPNTDDVKGMRLLVSDAASTNVHMLDAASGEALASFATAGQAGRVYPSPNGRFGFVIHREEDRVSLVHSGLTTVDHLDHVDLVQGAPYVAATMNVGREPTHFFAHDNDLAFFNDEDGTVSLLDQRLLGLSLDYAQVTVAQPDHGAPVIYGDYVLSGYYELGRVDIYRRSGERVTTIEDCPGLHGEAMAGDHIAYGCEDGVLLIQVAGDDFTDTKLANPVDTPEDVRVGTLAAHEDSAVMIGNFGAGVVIIDPATETFSPVELGANPLQMVFADGETLVILGDDGQLHLLEPSSGEILSSLQVIDAPDLEAEDAVRPSLILRGDFAYVSDPATQQLHEVALSNLSLRRSLALDFTPFSLAALSIPGATIHD